MPYGRLGIVPEKVSCDFYDWMAGRPEALNAYLGKTMPQYEWAELTNAWLGEKGGPDEYVFHADNDAPHTTGTSYCAIWRGRERRRP